MTSTGRPEGGRTNHLAGQTSPYLLQHARNPVDWYPWGPEALEKARREDRPIFLSIGYAACHWCHVMERESFEDEQVGAVLNAHFVPIKVDREERPDIDEIYMSAVQLLTGAGGWPLSVFLTPDLEPFFGGTYFPPSDRQGRPGFLDLLAKVANAWRSQRRDVTDSAAEITRHLRAIAAGGVMDPPGGSIGQSEISRAVAEVTARFDPAWGGFGGAPKFPPHGVLGLLLREHARSGEKAPLAMVTGTLDAMARGGIFDQIGGGFARYSTDARWLVPHFEKMLYDQALLVPVYTDAWLLTRRPLYRRIVEETLDFVRRELTGPEGGFLSSLDADSDGCEGKFYVWTPEEVLRCLGEDEGDLFCRTYGITADGNFEGRNIPNLLSALPEEHVLSSWAPMRAKLLAAREERPRPATDDKVLTAWNGLMITAFARAYQALGRVQDLASARKAADFLLSRVVRGDRLLATYREGTARLDAYLDDYAFFARGLLDLYETEFEPRDLDAATRLARAMLSRFEDAEHGGFFFTANDHERLLTRTRSTHDGALPSGAGVACETLLRLALHLDDARFREAAQRTLSSYRRPLERAPSAFTSLLAAADFARGPVPELVIIGHGEDPGTRALLAVLRERYLPRRVVALAPPVPGADGRPLLEGKTLLDGKPTAYVCRGYTCQSPTTEPAVLRQQLAD